MAMQNSINYHNHRFHLGTGVAAVSANGRGSSLVFLSMALLLCAVVVGGGELVEATTKTGSTRSDDAQQVPKRRPVNEGSPFLRGPRLYQRSFPRGKWTKRISAELGVDYDVFRDGLTEHETHLLRREWALARGVKPLLPTVLTAAVLLNVLWIWGIKLYTGDDGVLPENLVRVGLPMNLILIPLVAAAISRLVKWRKARRAFVALLKERLVPSAKKEDDEH